MEKKKQKRKLKILFSVDDVHPEIGFGLYKEKGNLGYLKKLNKEFGLKFTLFLVPFWNGVEKFNILYHKDWVSWLNKQPYFEIAGHGLTHKAEQREMKYITLTLSSSIPEKTFKYLEFFNLNNDNIEKRIKQMKNLFKKCGVVLRGFRTPGWISENSVYNILKKEKFIWLADHIFGEKIIELSNGLKLIPFNASTEDLEFAFFDDTLIIQSHINKKDGNKNGWDEKQYESVRNFLINLQKERELMPLTFSEFVEYEN